MFQSIFIYYLILSGIFLLLTLIFNYLYHTHADMESGKDMELDGVSWQMKMQAVAQWWMDMEYVTIWWNQLLIMLLGFYMRRKSLTRRYVLDRHFGWQHMLRIVYSSDASCKYHLRLNRAAFTKLCIMLKEIGGLRDTIHMLIDEQVAMLLHILLTTWRTG